MSARPVVAVEGLTVGHGARAILEGVTFDAYPGEVLAILGPSGSGKSSLLRHVIGLEPPLAGRVLVEGRDLASAEGEERSWILRRLGVAYQGGALFGSLTVLENVRLPLDELTDLPARVKMDVARAKLSLVGLLAAAERMPAELSGGMQKRAALARAMALDPRILFLDEPSAGLDPITSAGLDELIRRLARTFDVAVVVVTHELASIFAIADRVILLDAAARGVIAVGDPRALRDASTDPRVLRFLRREPS